MLAPANYAAATDGQDYQWARFTKPQREFLARTDPAVVWRGANGIGKSIALAILSHDTCRGVERFAPIVMKPPVQVMIAGVSWEQMVPLMQKVWTYAPKDEIDPRNSWDPGRGITGKPPRIVYKRGPGAGSVISFATYRQGSQRVAGLQVPLMLLDEPPPERFLGEALPRVLRYGGRIRIGFTPTLDSPPLDYLWEKVDVEKTIVELETVLSEEACWLEGAPRPWKTQVELDLIEKSYLGPERAMRTGRSRYPLVGDRWISAFEDRHINEVLPKWPHPDFEWVVGLDWGLAPGKTVGVLLGNYQPWGDPPMIFFHDIYKGEGITGIEDDAVGVLHMLERNGLDYDDVTYWVGDRKAEARAQGVEKSNDDFRGALASIMRRTFSEVKRIRTPKKNEGSVTRGAALINDLFARTRANVRPHMKPLIDAYKTWNGDPKHPTKDAFDASSYAVQKAVKRYRTEGSSIVAVR